MTDDTYNGWANRETWAFNLHLSNDEGLWNHVLDMASLYLAEKGEVSDLWLGEAILEHVEEDLPEMAPELWESMRSDVGSFWRVNCAETGRAIREALEDQ